MKDFIQLLWCFINIIKQFFDFFHLFERQIYMEKDLPSSCSFLEWTARAVTGQSWEPGASSESPTWVPGPSTWAIFCRFPRNVSRELDLKWNCWFLGRQPCGCWCCRQWLRSLYHNSSPEKRTESFQFFKECVEKQIISYDLNIRIYTHLIYI